MATAMQEREDQQRRASLTAGNMADRVRAFDWAATPLGRKDRWPDSLTTLVELMLATPQLATLTVGPERTFLYNDAAGHYYGTRHPAVLGLSLAEAFPHEYHQVSPFYDRVFAGESLHIPAQTLDPADSGLPEVFDAYLTPVRDGGGVVIAAFMTGFATGDRRRVEAKLRESEERQALLLRLSDALRIISDPAEIRRSAMHLLGEQLGLARLYYFDVERDEDGGWTHVIERGFQRDPDQIEFVGRYSLSDFGDWMFEGFARGEVIAVSDIETHAGLTENERAAYRAVGVGAFINVPLLRDGDYAAGIGAHDIAPRVWTEAEFDLIREVAARTWTATERARVEKALRESEARLASDLAGMRRIHALHGRLAAERDLRGALGAIVAAAVELAGTDRGCIQLVNADGERLEMFAFQGYAEQDAFIQHFMHEGSKPACDAARRDRRRMEIDDVATFPGLAGTRDREVALIDGVRATNSTPMLSRAGELVGVLSVQFRELHFASDADNRLLDLLAWTAADFAERHHATARLGASEARFRAIVTSGAVSIYRMSPDWRLMYEMDSANFLAPTPEPIEHWADDYILPDDRPMVFAAIKAAIRDRAIFDLEHRVTLADGGVGWVSSRAVPMLGPDGEIVEWFGAGADITERKRAEEAVRDSEDRFRTLSDNIAQLVWTCDRLGEVTWYNQRWFDYTGLTFAEMKDWGWAKVQHPDHVDRVVASVTRSRDNGEPWEDTFPLRRHDGVYRWFLSQAIPIRNAAGEVVRWFGTNTDITERREADAALRASEARLSAAFESVPVGLAVLDAAGNAILANSGYRRFLPNGVVPSRDADRGWRWRAWDERGEMIAKDDFPAARAARGERVTPGMEMLYTDDDGREIWTRVAAIPIVDATGAVTGQACVISDIDAIKRGAAALRDSEELLRQFGEASQDILWIRDVEKLQWQYLTPAFEAVYGLSREEALSGDNYRNWLDLIVPEDQAYASEMIRRVGGGERVTFEFRIRRPVDGAIRWMRNTDFPITNDAGEVVLIGGIGHDATELREAESRLQALVDGIPQLVWRAVDGGEWTWASPQWTDYTGQAERESEGWGWMEPLHPDDREVAREAWKHAIEHGGIEVEYRLRGQRDGVYRWFQSRATPVRDEGGSIIEWLGTSTDIHDLRELQERQKVLVAELQHRTRNLIGVVRSLSERTRDYAALPEEFHDRFALRLVALSRVQGLLSHLSAGERVSFDELLRSELAALGATGGLAGRVTLDGLADVPLRSATVQTFALALHELATNAVKYGALSAAHPGGRLAVRWHVEPVQADDAPRLHVDWRESGVAMPQVGAATQGGGYGRELIERALPYQLKAKTTYELGDDGVHCTIVMAIAAQETKHRP